MFLLKFGSMDGQDGELNERAGGPLIEEIAIPAANAWEAAKEANAALARVKSVHHIPFMPELFDSQGDRVAATNAQPPYAHRLTLIKGSAVGSSEEWVSV